MTEQQFTGYRPKCRVFAAELTSDGRHGTGKLVEIPFQTIAYNNSSDLGGKSMSITMPNPGTLFTTSVTEGIPGHRDGDTITEHIKNIMQYRVAVQVACGDSIAYANPLLRNATPDVRTKQAYGISPEALRIFTLPAGETVGGLNNSFMVAKMQRIWTVIKTEGLGKENATKYSIVAGVIGGFTETYDVNGSAIWSINCKGLARFLDLTPAHIQYFIEDINKTLFNEIAKNIISPVVLENNKGMENILADMSIPTAMMYSVWLANTCFTQMGYVNNYNVSDRSRFSSSSDMFNFELLWQFYDANNIPPQEDIIKAQYYAEQGSFSLVDDPKTVWAAGMRNALYNNAENHLASLDLRPGDQTIMETLARLLFSDPSKVVVLDLIPKVYYDPLIIKMLDPKKALSVFQKKIRAGFQLFSTSTMTAAEILQKIASTILAVCREDDFGNIILEIPRNWMAPLGKNSTESDDQSKITSEYNCNSDYKKFWEEYKEMPASDGALHDADYIIDKMAFKVTSRTENEDNIVTHVEASAIPQYITVDQTLQTKFYVGRVDAISEESSNFLRAYLRDMQSRYGLRIFQAPPLYTAGLSGKIGLNEQQQTELQKVLNKYAESMLFYKNSMLKAQTVQYQAYHWLDCNRTMFMPERNELWMIANKQFSYSAKGSLSFSMTMACGHAIGEQVSYPFLDLYIWATNNSNSNQLIDVEAEATQIAEQKKKDTAAYVADQKKNKAEDWRPLVNQVCADYAVDPDLILSVMWQETGGTFKMASHSSAGATGVMQIMQATFDYIKAGHPEIKGDINNDESNVRAGTLYLRDQLRLFAGKARLALYAYNAGPGTVIAGINEFLKPQIPYTATNIWGVANVLNRTQILAICNAPSNPKQSPANRQQSADYVVEVTAQYRKYTKTTAQIDTKNFYTAIVYAKKRTS